MSDRPTLYLHIGAAKSGSSAIQAMLRDNASRLRQQGILVPANDLRPGGRVDGAQVPFFEQLLPVGAQGIALVGERLFGLADHLRGQNLRAAVISAENLFNTDEFARLFQAAQSTFDIRVVLYIRRQDEYLVGAWNQWYFKTNPDFPAWVAEVRGGLANWDVIVSRWEKRLPEATFDVRVFDRRTFPGGDIVLDFLSVLGVEPNGMTLPEAAVNRGLNQVAMRVALRNRYLFKDAQDHGFIEFLADLGGEPAFERIEGGLYFTPESRRELLDAYSESNERLRTRHFPDLEPGQLFSTPDGSGSRALGSEELAERELDLIWNVLYQIWLGARQKRQR